MTRIVDVVNEMRCTGCTACASICPKSCISLIENNEGFLNPTIDYAKCINCNLCEKKCPALTKSLNQKPISCYAMYNKDHEILIKSSSGGFFYGLAKYVIKQGGTVFGAIENNKMVYHIKTRDINEIMLMLGSKYTQSNLKYTFKEVERELLLGQLVLFSGTPCQIHGLKLFLENNTNLDNLITIDVVCRSIPSPKVYKLYCDYIEKKHNDEITNFNFRSKDIGWYNTLIKITMKNKIIKEENYNNSYMKLFYKDLISRKSCFDCPSKGFKSGSDFTLGDFWTIKKRAPKLDNQYGVSLVIVNSFKAEDIFSKICDEYIFEKANLKEVLNDSYYLYKSIEKNDEREKVFYFLDKKSYMRVIYKFLGFELLINKIKKAISWKR